MIDTLGVWLPETSEIGVGLQQAAGIEKHPIPITVSETIDLFQEKGLLQKGYSVSEKEAEPRGDRSPQVLISGKNLRFEYPGGVEALRGITFDIHQGEWLMILGRNRAGKSTWLICSSA